SPHMLLVADVLEDKRSVIPAVTHVDGTARVQTVNAADNPRQYKVVKAFEAITGVPVVLNTSFNDHGEPIVETPLDAFECFAGTELDVLVLGKHILHKEIPVEGTA
ncbi:carbamoyl transferase, partial [bacterium]|nr:carbamoyl transferase [bacterium]